MAVTPDDIAVGLGQAAPQPDSITDKQWKQWIDDAEMLIDLRVAKLDVDPPSELVRDYVVRESVISHVRKPDDATQVTVSVDDASTSKTYHSGRGRPTITDEWWLMLGLVEVSSGAFSVDMLGVASVHLPWCSLYFGATYCSCGVDIAGTPIFEGGDDL